MTIRLLLRSVLVRAAAFSQVPLPTKKAMLKRSPLGRDLAVKSISSSFGSTGFFPVVLCPISTNAPPAFKHIEGNAALRSRLLAEMQRFRGNVYLEDGAIMPEELTSDGRHQLVIDEYSWHLLTLNKAGAVSSCLRFLPEANCTEFDELWLRHSALTNSAVWGSKLRRAVEREMTQADRARLCFGEVGGWAVAPERRLTAEPLRTVLSICGLLQLLGGCAGIVTATRRHDSAPILRRVGLSPLQADGEDLPPYYDPQYRCEMEILRFDTRYPPSKYQDWICELGSYLSHAPVIASPLPDGSSRARRPVPLRDWAVTEAVPVGAF